MELNKSIISLILVSYILSLPAEAHRHHRDVALSPSSPTSSYQPSPDNPCKPFLHFNFSFLHSPSMVNPILANLCDATHNPVMCCAFLTPCLSIGNTVDSTSILNTLILQLSAQVDYAIFFAQGLCKTKSLSPSITKSIETSIELYTKVVDELQDGIVVLKAGDFYAVKTMFISCVSKFGLCDQAFQLQGSSANWPLKGLNELLTELAGFGVDISAKLSLKYN